MAVAQSMPAAQQPYIVSADLPSSEAAIFCCRVMVNLRVTLLLDYIKVFTGLAWFCQILFCQVKTLK